MKLVYTRRYNIGFLGLERLHPFDSRKYGRAWNAVGREERRLRNRAWMGVPRPASFADLSAVHDPAYLDRLRDSKVLASALELPFIRRLPAWAVRWTVLRPMRWAVAGSLVAGRAALTDGLSVNLSGGYHHAKPDRGEGFCVFNDVAYLIHRLRTEGRLAADGRVAYIGLDAHQGNGVSLHFRSDTRVLMYDAYNPRIYPSYDHGARARIDCPVPLPANCTGAEYLRVLELSLPGFLDSVGRSGRVALAVDNAGTDVYAGDALGGPDRPGADLRFDEAVHGRSHRVVPAVQPEQQPVREHAVVDERRGRQVRRRVERHHLRSPAGRWRVQAVGRRHEVGVGGPERVHGAVHVRSRDHARIGGQHRHGPTHGVHAVPAGRHGEGPR
ncbi:histone deacetylase [Gemmata obscuriglobus]|uniref:Histone deacetylase n=1 Tax=Gemmata obscuriglobus TaxID=114 RepID=A0A2Z3H596_9BACT|nr:histone deacetylase [Gemmata obscuriglobus]